MATQATLEAVQQLYLAYYGRPGDPAGVTYWADRYEAEGQAALTDLYAEFGASQEFLDNFAPYLDDTGAIDDAAGAITLLYQQMFNRDPDALGLSYYIDLLNGTNDSGLNPELRQSSLANIAADIANGATDGDPAAGDSPDATILANKTTVAITFTTEVEAGNRSFTAADIAGAQAIIASVTDDPDSVDAGNAEAVAFVAALPVQGTPGDTFTLTQAVETVDGTPNDDTFNAPLETAPGTGAQVQTLTSGDTVNGGLGLDTMNVQLNGGLTAPTVSSVEVFNVRPLGGAPELNFANISGAQAVNFNGNVVDATLSSVASRVELGARNITGDGHDITVGYVSTVSGNQILNVEEADLNSLVLNGGGIGAMQINAVAGTTDIDSVTGTAVATALTGVTIAGPGDLEVSLDGTAGSGPANLRTVDGSTATGSLNIVLNQPGLDQTVMTGSGDDRLEMTGLNNRDSIDLGAGDDMLVNNGNLNGASYNVTNVETVRMDVQGAGPFALNAGAFEDAVATFTVYAEDNSAPNVENVDVVGLEATDVVQLRDRSDIPRSPAQSLGNVTLMGRDTTGSSDAISVQVRGVDGDQSFTINTLAADAYESMSLESTGEAPEADQRNLINALTDGNLGTLTITGDRALEIGNASKISTIDASAFTADLMLGLGEATHTVTGGTGDDTFRIDFDHLRANDTIDGGDGTDTLAFTGATNPDLTGANAARLGGVSNFENIGLGIGLALSIDDQTLASFTGQTINVVVDAGAAGASVDASGVGGTATAINVDASEATGPFDFTMSNGVDTLLGGDGDDTVTVQDDFSLSGTDTLTGGDGTNTLLISDDADGATITVADLANVTGFGTFQFESNAGQTTAITLDNSLALANRDPATNTITVEPGATGTGKLNLNASAVGAAVSVDATGGGEADTIRTGAGNDELEGGGANDTLTTGAGRDDVVAGADFAAQGTDTVTDMDLGSGTTVVDQLDMTANTVASAITQAALLLGTTGTGPAIAGGTNVFVLNDKAYDSAAAIDTELFNSASTQTQSIVLWQNGLGDVFVGTDADASADNGGADIETLFMLDNTTISAVAASLNVNAVDDQSDILV